jgi:tetratricopeptide (TPR) repeat protein
MRHFVGILLLSILLGATFFTSSICQPAKSYKFKEKNDTASVNKMIAKAYLNWNSNPIEGIAIGQQALVIADSLNYPFGKAWAFKVIGVCYWAMGSYESAFQSLVKGYKISEKQNFKELQAAIENDLALVNEDIGNTEEAILFYKRNIDWYKSQNKLVDLARSYNNLGTVYFEKKMFDSAMHHYNYALSILKKDEKSDLTWGLYLGIGQILFKQKKFKEAMLYAEKALRYYEQNTDKVELTESLILRGSIRIAIKDNAGAKADLLKAKEISERSRFTVFVSQTFEAFARLDSATGNFKGAYSNYKKALSIRDSISNLHRKDAFSRLMLQYKTEEEIADNKSLRQEALTKEALLKKSQTIIALFVIGFLFAITAAYFFFRGLRSKQAAYNKLNRLKNKLETQQILLEETNRKYAELNLNLEKLVLQRTEKIELQNQKLIEYGFLNSHEIRGPVARIQGLLNLSAIDKNMDREELLAMLKKATDEVDQKINEITIMLSKNSF